MKVSVREVSILSLPYYSMALCKMPKGHACKGRKLSKSMGLQVAVINIPPVRQKSREQLEKRQAEVLALKRRAAQYPPATEHKDDSSSGEDTSDEAFLARHQPGWEEEHRRNYAPAAGAAPVSLSCSHVAPCLLCVHSCKGLRLYLRDDFTTY